MSHAGETGSALERLSRAEEAGLYEDERSQDCEQQAARQEGRQEAVSTSVPFHHYLRAMADALGLKDWDFFVEANDETGPYQATCAIIVGQKRAKLGFPPSFDNLSPSQQRQTVVHELLHSHFDQWKIVINRLSGMLTDRELMLTELAMRDVVEQGIDGVATAIAGWLPLPEAAA